MGPKQQPKKYLDSSKNIGGSLTKKRKGGEEFSDNDLISEDDQYYQDDQDEREDQQEEKPLPGIKSNLSQKTNTPSSSKRHGTGNYEVRRAHPLEREAVTVDDIAGPKKKVATKLHADSICTRVFMYQLFIIITCSFLVSYCSVYFLNDNVHVSDTSYRSYDKDHTIDIYSEVLKAIGSELDNADFDGKVQDKIDIILDNADIDNKVQEALRYQVPNIVRDEAKGGAVTSLIEAKLSEKSSDIESKLSSKIVAVKAETDQFTNLLNENIKTIGKASNDIKELKSSISDFTNKQATTELELESLVASVKVTDSSVDKMSKEYSELLNTIEEKSAEIVILQRSITEGEKQLNKMNTEFLELKEKLSETKDLYAKYKSEVEQLEEIKSKLAVMQPNVFNKDSFIMAFMILIVIVFVLAASVYNLYQRPNNAIPGRTGGRTSAREQKNNLGKHDILKTIPEGPELEAGVCIISFDESRTATHRRILDSANIPNCRVQVHVVRRHEHIPELPRCKVYLMCTEFSERHVIIEEPGKGLGDLHRTTYDAVVKLKGCLIILYTRDPGSRNLKDQVRYNEKIYCVANQPELSDLNQDGRFFSVFDNLNNYQKSELRRKITEYMI